MSESIEMLEQWYSPESKAYYDHLQGELAKAMAVPAYLQREPDLILQHTRRAIQNTENLRREIAKIYEAFCTRAMLVKRENLIG